MITHYFLTFLLDDRKRNRKLGSLAQLTLALDVTLVEIDDLLDIGKTEAEALYIVDVASMYTIELLEDLLNILLLDTQTCVADAEAEAVLIVPSTDIKVERLVRFAILHSIIHQIGDGILEMHFVNVDGRVDGFYLCIDMSARMLHS